MVNPQVMLSCHTGCRHTVVASTFENRGNVSPASQVSHAQLLAVYAAAAAAAACEKVCLLPGKRIFIQACLTPDHHHVLSSSYSTS